MSESAVPYGDFRKIHQPAPRPRPGKRLVRNAQDTNYTVATGGEGTAATRANTSTLVRVERRSPR